jgi:L-lactate dehydrogenase complex protein LldG
MPGIVKIKNKMESRERILKNIAHANAKKTPLPELSERQGKGSNDAEEFVALLEKIGGKVVEVKDSAAVGHYVLQQFPSSSRILTTIPELPWFASPLSEDPHAFENVDLAILRGHFGVAENGAVWITDQLMGDRSIPFISQHLALVINKQDIVPTLHAAYERIASDSYEYGTFIAGPSKTADIEQSLVLGAHGPKSMIVFMMTAE